MVGEELEPSVSVLLVTHNSCQHLPTLWKDLEAQTWRNLDVIVVDNASTDSSLDFIRDHPLKASIKVLPQSENLGVTGAWNIGARETRSKWVLLISPDCRFPADLIAGLVKRAEAAGKAIGKPDLIGGVTPQLLWKGAPGAPRSLPPHVRPLQKGLPQGIDRNGETFGYHGACVLLSTEMVRDIGGFDTNLFFGGDENDTALRAHLKGWHFIAAPEVSVEHPYEVRQGSRSSQTLLLRSTSVWYLLLKHAGITLSWGSLLKESIHHLFWQRRLASPRFLLSELTWFVRKAQDIRMARLDMRRQWASRSEAKE
jgi:hypothetical protein